MAEMGPVISAVDEFGDTRFTEGQTTGAASRQAEVDALTQRATQQETALNALRTEYAAHMQTHVVTPPPDPDPEPEPEPEPPTTGKAIIGMSAPANLWAARKRDVEATGGKLGARRVFLQGFDSSLTLVQAAHAEGLLPVVSFKPGDWGNVAAGQSDTALRTLAGRLKALGKEVVMIVHHEPDAKSDPKTQGEGGTGAEFAAMQHRVIDVVRPLAPNVRFWVCMNGWWWDGTNGAFTDAEINVWLPASLRSKLDGVAADDYSPSSGSNPAVTKTRNRCAWAKRMGDVKAVGVGETNAFTAKELADVFAYAKTEPIMRGGFILLWNSEGGTYLPVNETGLLDDFQGILRAW